MFDLGRTLLQSIERSPGRTAIVDGPRRFTYAQWAQMVGAVQRGLAAAGLRHGDHLLVVLQNRWEMAALHWACQFAGIVVTPLNWRAKADEIDHCLSDSQARAVVWEGVADAAMAHSKDAARVLRIGVGEVNALGGTQLQLEDWLADATSGGAEPLPLATAEDLSLMLYTSGTTGKPKGVPRRHRTERAAALAHVAQNRYGDGECTLGVMPLYHTMGVRSLLALALVDGCVVCMPRFDAQQALAAIAAERVSHLYLVPTLYHDLLAHPDFAATDITSVTKLGFAGAPMHDALLQRLQAAFRPELFVNHYGSSEVYTFSINQRAVAKPGSAGRAGLNTRLRVVTLDTTDPMRLAAPGEEGQIIADLAGDEAFEGYHRRPDADAKSLHGGWYFTGDMGYVDGDGDLYVTGRVDDMIISGGENISPVDIESVLSLHPAVDEVAVAGLPDPRWGQKVVAFVKLHASADANADADAAVDATMLDAHCRSSDLVNFKRPRDYVFVREIPKSPVGKVLRRKLQAGDYEAAPFAPISKG